MSTKAAYPSYNPADAEDEAGLLNVYKNALLKGLRVALPAVIVSFDKTINRAVVAPAITSASSNGETINLPELSDVPVCTAGGGGFAASFPLVQGDTGWLLFCDRDISLFKASGVISPANTDRLHNLADAVFLPDIMGKANLSASNAAVWQTYDGSVRVEISETGISVTGNTAVNGDLSVAGDLSVTGEIDAQGDITAQGDVRAGAISLLTHVHGGVQGGSGTTGGPQ